MAFLGAPGTGKSHLSIAIGVKAVHQGYNVIFTTVNQMLEELGLKKLNQNSVDDFYEIIARRYENNSTIITSNKSFEEWGRIFFDPVLATAILDRFVHHCHFITIEGESYRMKERQGIILRNENQIKPKKGRPSKEARQDDLDS